MPSTQMYKEDFFALQYSAKYFQKHTFWAAGYNARKNVSIRNTDWILKFDDRLIW